MVTEQDKLDEEQTVIYELLETIRRFSPCKDKQVAAISTDEMGKLLSVNYNMPTGSCDMCNSKEHPKHCAVHAEAGLLLQKNCCVYITTFPCADCQMLLWSVGVGRVYVFGNQHKEDTGLLDITLLPDVASTLVAFNGLEKQLTVVMGELAELITAIADSSRKDTKDNRDLWGEVVDVELQLKCLRRVLEPTDLTTMKCEKYNKLIRRYK